MWPREDSVSFAAQHARMSKMHPAVLAGEQTDRYSKDRLSREICPQQAARVSAAGNHLARPLHHSFRLTALSLLHEYIEKQAEDTCSPSHRERGNRPDHRRRERDRFSCARSCAEQGETVLRRRLL